MLIRRSLVGVFLFTCCLFLGAKAARACSCGPTPTVLESFDGSEVVAILRLKSVEKATDGRYVDGVKSSVLEVIKVFKGNKVRPGDQLTFGQGGGADCIWTFNEKAIGDEYLLYLVAPKKPGEVWLGFGCGRSRGVESATDDLLYLNNLPKVAGKTRVSGTIHLEDADDVRRDGIKIRITDGKRKFDTKTDAHGVYEVYDIPAGKYFVEFEPIKGWKLNTFYLSYSRSIDPAADPKVLPRIPIIVEDKKHASLDLHFEIDNAIRGRIIGPDGNPMGAVCLHAIDPDPAVKSGYHADCTDTDGSFTIDELPRGKYILVINDDGKIDADEPFPTFYYPNVTDRSKATVLYIGPGEFIDGVNITVPEVADTVTVEGVLLYSDGKPVADEKVQFNATGTEPDSLGDSTGGTDNEGRFSFKILTGSRGTLFGSMYTYSGEFVNCPKLEKLIKASGKSVPSIRTAPLSIEADRNIAGLVLKFPFPRCEKAKDEDDED